VRSASLTPAELLGLSAERGHLGVGTRADLVCVDGDLRPTAVLAGGRWVTGPRSVGPAPAAI
jgi:N-acetylglucosamine-6-phosphate deacetylase